MSASLVGSEMCIRDRSSAESSAELGGVSASTGEFGSELQKTGELRRPLERELWKAPTRSGELQRVPRSDG
eukprot:15352342-Alexandrium_andersonii.AAC.1